MKTKVHRIELYVIDHDALGADGVAQALENARYPNRCIQPVVQRVETREVEWSDDHPLNRRATAEEAYSQLFAGEPS